MSIFLFLLCIYYEKRGKLHRVRRHLFFLSIFLSIFFSFVHFFCPFFCPFSVLFFVHLSCPFFCPFFLLPIFLSIFFVHFFYPFFFVFFFVEICVLVPGLTPLYCTVYVYFAQRRKIFSSNAIQFILSCQGLKAGIGLSSTLVGSSLGNRRNLSRNEQSVR